MKETSLKKLKNIKEPGVKVANWQLKATKFDYDVEQASQRRIVQLRIFIFLTPGVNDNKLFEQLLEEVQIEEDTGRKVKKEKVEPDTDLSIFDILCNFDGARQKGVTAYAYIINEGERRLVENYGEC